MPLRARLSTPFIVGWLWQTGLVGVLIIWILPMLRSPGSTRLTVVLVSYAVLVAVVAAAGIIRVPATGRSLTYDSTGVTVTSRFSERRILATSIDRVVVANAVKATTGSVPVLLLLDAQGGALLRIAGDLWPNDRFDSVARAVSSAPETVVELVTPAELRNRYPRAIPWLRAHPSLVLAVVLLLPIVVVGAGKIVSLITA